MNYGGELIIDDRNPKTAWSYFPHIKSAAELRDYLDIRIKGHKYFYHYTSLNAINAILKSQTIRLSSVDRFNDKKDSKQFGEISNQKKYFSICFTSGANENLSLWYLYSGIDGKGGRIALSNKKLEALIRKGEFYLTEYDYENNINIGNSVKLTDGDNMKLDFRDVLYSRPDINGKYISLKYNTMTNYGNIPIEEFNIYKEDQIGFSKGIIWYYEKETRLLIELIGKIVDEIDANKNYSVLWRLGDDVKNIKIMFAPEIEDKSVISQYEDIDRFIFYTSRASLSDNAGEVEMKICTKCNYEEKFCSKCKIKKEAERSFINDKHK